MQGESVRRGTVVPEQLRRPRVSERPFVRSHHLVGRRPGGSGGQSRVRATGPGWTRLAARRRCRPRVEVEPGEVGEVPERAAPDPERRAHEQRPSAPVGSRDSRRASWREMLFDAVSGDPARGLVVGIDAFRDQGRDQRVQEQRVSAGRAWQARQKPSVAELRCPRTRQRRRPRFPAATAGSAHRWRASGPRRAARGKRPDLRSSSRR